jgi:hypothetical protein
MEFESSDRKPAPPSHVCVIYDPRDGRIVHGHIFVGKSARLFGPEGREERERETLDGARRIHGDVSKLRTFHVPSDFRFAPNAAYRVDSKSNRLIERPTGPLGKPRRKSLPAKKKKSPPPKSRR